MTLPEWMALDGDAPPRGWTAARTAMVYGTPPAVIVELLRLLLPCQRCGAQPLAPCKRGLGEVNATHLTRGA